MTEINPPSPKGKLGMGYQILMVSQVNMVLGKLNMML
jgi:hypothetical protein